MYSRGTHNLAHAFAAGGLPLARPPPSFHKAGSITNMLRCRHMENYHFHVRGGVDRSLTPDGRQLVDLDAAKREALRNAREIMAHDVLMGNMDLNLHIVVLDGGGDHV